MTLTSIENIENLSLGEKRVARKTIAKDELVVVEEKENNKEVEPLLKVSPFFWWRNVVLCEVL